MNATAFTMNLFFKQLGLAHTDTAINEFILSHAPVCGTVPLHKYPIWSKSQKAFLQQAIAEDSDWCVMAEQLDARLREGKHA